MAKFTDSIGSGVAIYLVWTSDVTYGDDIVTIRAEIVHLYTNYIPISLVLPEKIYG